MPRAPSEPGAATPAQDLEETGTGSRRSAAKRVPVPVSAPDRSIETRHTSAPHAPCSRTEKRYRHKPDRCEGMRSSPVIPCRSRQALECPGFRFAKRSYGMNPQRFTSNPPGVLTPQLNTPERSGSVSAGSFEPCPDSVSQFDFKYRYIQFLRRFDPIAGRPEIRHGLWRPLPDGQFRSPGRFPWIVRILTGGVDRSIHG
jgi:hypothetical protein